MIGIKRRYYEEVDSTNTKAKEWAKQGAKDGSVVIADKQWAGKGRGGKCWASPAGVGIWMSIILRPTIKPQAIAPLTLIAGLAMSESIEEETGLEVGIKWPNDLVVHNKKICGILCEMHATQERVEYAIVGVGVNVNTEHFPEELPYASSLYLEKGKKYNREHMINRFCEIFEGYYMDYIKTEAFDALVSKYEDKCITLNKKVKIIDNQQTYEAYAKGISSEGHLIIQPETGEDRQIFAGEVSVRGLYGYV
ncbi:MAG: biotin--[acetyl-CoA-carboxylase] ligase [Cellulosilyticaceae bacterium]